MGSGTSAHPHRLEIVSDDGMIDTNINDKKTDLSAKNPKTSSSQIQQNNNIKYGRRKTTSQHSAFSLVVDSDEGDNIVEEEFILTTQYQVCEVLERLEQNKLYCDPHFPANDRVLFFNGYHNDMVVKWIRPHELVLDGTEPEMMIDGITRDDIQQGILGDCWFLSSCAAVSQQERFMKNILPKDQSLWGHGYHGVVCFRFWRFGEWVEVYIDDRLPTVDRKLIYAHCTEPNEFWVALIEKAYAKLRGCYQALEGGQTMDALVDLTGGLAERYVLEEYDPNMYRLILRAHKSGAFIACSRKGDWRARSSDATGLVSGHAYTITSVIKIQHQMGEEKLLRIRNPWGDATEWKGSWSDNDVNWKWVDKKTKGQMELQSKDDGEFWMSFKDFYRHFQEVTICLTGPDFDGDGISDAVGHMQITKGEWIKGVSAGGSRNSLELFKTNPQYLLTLHQADDFNLQTDDPELEGLCSVVIALMQDQKPTREADQNAHQQIAFVIYETDDPKQRLSKRYFHSHHDCGRSGLYINYREVSGRFELSPGYYVIIPSMFQPHIEGKFLIRVFGENKFSLKGPLR